MSRDMASVADRPATSPATPSTCQRQQIRRDAIDLLIQIGIDFAAGGEDPASAGRKRRIFDQFHVRHVRPLHAELRQHIRESLLLLRMHGDADIG